MKGHRKNNQIQMASYNVLSNQVWITQRRNPDNLWRIGSDTISSNGLRRIFSVFNIQEEQDEILGYAQFEDQGRHAIFVRATQYGMEQMFQYINEMENNVTNNMPSSERLIFNTSSNDMVDLTTTQERQRRIVFVPRNSNSNLTNSSFWNEYQNDYGNSR